MAIDLPQWRAFLAVAERGSLMKAAETLHTDQPALSRRRRSSSAPPLATFATVIAHIAAGDGWLLSARTLARHTPPGLAAKRLAVTLRRKLQFEIIWHVNTDPVTIDAFSARIQQALA